MSSARSLSPLTLSLVVCIVACRAPAAEPARGPVCAWDFERSLRDAAGATPDQLSAWAPSGAVVLPRRVAADELPGANGRAVALGVKPDDPAYLSGCTSADVRLGPSYTVALWVHATKLDVWARLVLCWGPGDQHGYHVAVHNGMASLYHGQADGTEAICEGGRVQTGRWHHIAAVAERNHAQPARSTLRVYLDGARVATAPYDGTHRPHLGEGIGIGDSASAPSADCRFRGYLDDVLLWHRALTADEIARLGSRRGSRREEEDGTTDPSAEAARRRMTTDEGGRQRGGRASSADSADCADGVRQEGNGEEKEDGTTDEHG